MPPVLEINRPYLELYKLCSDQYIMGPGGAVGLNALAVDRMMDYREVEIDEREDFLMKVKLVAAHVIKEIRKADEAEAAQRKSQSSNATRRRR